LILAELALSDTAGGLLQSAFITTYSLACPVAGWLGDRQPRARLAAAGVFVIVARAVIGVGEANSVDWSAKHENPVMNEAARARDGRGPRSAVQAAGVDAGPVEPRRGA
jgi:nitrate/nitrite transporter NarK